MSGYHCNRCNEWHVPAEGDYCPKGSGPIIPIVGKAPDNHVTDRLRERGELPESLDPKNVE